MELNKKDLAESLDDSKYSVIFSSLICSSGKLEIPKCSVTGDWRHYETFHVMEYYVAIKTF